MITGRQVKAARALLGWEARDLAERSGVSASTISRFEAGKSDLYSANLTKLQRTLEAAGILFLASDDDGPGVRLRSGPLASRLAA